MKFEAPTRSTCSLSNFWNPTNPQTSDPLPCRTSPCSTPLYRRPLSSLNSPLLSSSSNKPQTLRQQPQDDPLSPPKQSTITPRHTHPRWRGTQTHQQNPLCCEIRQCLCLQPYSHFSFSRLHILSGSCSSLNAFNRKEKKNLSSIPRSVPPQLWNTCFQWRCCTFTG